MNAVLEYNGTLIREREEMLSLTDMWKASGRPSNREPFNWARFEGAPFVEAVATLHNLSGAQVMITKKGKGGGTWGHWQIAFAYAKYLSHEFHVYCNTVVRDHMERMREARLPLQAPDFNADAFTRADTRGLTHFYIGIVRVNRLVAKPLVNQGLPVRRSELEEKMRVVVALADLRVSPTCEGAQ